MNTTTYKTTPTAANSTGRSTFNASNLGNTNTGNSSSPNGSSHYSNGTFTEAVTTKVRRWGCCGNASRPCLAHLQNPQGMHASKGGAAVWAWNESVQSMVVKEQCTKMKAECCRSEPWPDGEPYRYPWRVTPSDDAPYQVLRPSPSFFILFFGRACMLERTLISLLFHAYMTFCATLVFHSASSMFVLSLFRTLSAFASLSPTAAFC